MKKVFYYVKPEHYDFGEICFIPEQISTAMLHFGVNCKVYVLNLDFYKVKYIRKINGGGKQQYEECFSSYEAAAEKIEKLAEYSNITGIEIVPGFFVDGDNYNAWWEVSCQ